MSRSPAHEIWKTLLGRLVEVLTFELDIPMRSGGSITFRREELERGLEPDECYWIASVSLLPTDREYDPQRDPPPDLALEIEYSRSALDRQGIYAALRVPELWRYAATRCMSPCCRRMENMRSPSAVRPFRFSPSTSCPASCNQRTAPMRRLECAGF